MAQLVIDLLGGDRGSAPLFAGALRALDANKDLSLFLVGDISAESIPISLRSRVEITANSLAVTMDDSPVGALRNKADCSMAQAISIYVEGNADAVVSAGNTGALVGFSVQKLGLMAGVSRPAIAAAVPTKSGKTWLLDVGATLQLSSQRLCELANLGAALSRVDDGKLRPRLALLNVGSEQSKGTSELKNAAELMSASEKYQFVGNVEGDQLFQGDQDVIVCDGFSGNIAIKTAQGISRLLKYELDQMFRTNLYSKFIAVLLSPILKKFGKRIDPALYNGAPLLGLNGLIVKSHGSADEKAFANAILVAAEMADRDLVAAINASVQAQI